MGRLLGIAVMWLAGLLAVGAQDIRQGELIVELKREGDLRALMVEMDELYPHLQVYPKQQLIPRFQYWLLHYDSTRVSAAELAGILRRQPTVKQAQPNHCVRLRRPLNTTPNDPSFGNQWQYVNNGSNGGAVDADMDAPEAWDITTGGYTVTNERIVIAVIDDGLDLTHNDILGNVWINTAEIDANNVDDDQNGYVDDRWGWNSLQNNDDIGTGSAGAHGTSVAGIIGARGNNSLGVAGVNWDTDLMIIRNNGNTTEANVLASYGYALAQRRIYNETNGTKGAFVVATNASWGLNYGQPSNAPLWCAFYDTLGKYGILNVAATANLNIDVDAQGDLPTACPSDFLLSVTNVNRLGDKLYSAGYGAGSIDLGAYGESVYTTLYSNGYGTFGGTSAAAPHVTGAIGLIYAAACTNFILLAKASPADAARLAKRWIMEGVVPESTLSQTVSGGCLNLYNTLQLAVDNCPSTCLAPYAFYADPLTDSVAVVHWTSADMVQQLSLRYRPVGGGVWSADTLLAADSIRLTALLPCTDYEVQIVSHCDSSFSDTATFAFSTDGCCLTPDLLSVVNTNNQQVTLSWSPRLAAQYYTLQLRKVGTVGWATYDHITTTQYTVSDLDICTYYEWQVRMLCASGDTTEFAHVQTFITDGCQSCFSINYCTAAGQTATNDWIQRFTLDTFDHSTGNNSGYYAYAGHPITLAQNNTYNFLVQQGAAYLEYVRLWADWNQDGDFEDMYELVGEGNIPYVSSMSGTLSVPFDAASGITRLRVAMRWNTVPDDCGTIPYGEVEDYCIRIIPNTAVSTVAVSADALQVFPNPFDRQLHLRYTLAQPAAQVQLAIFSAAGQQVYHHTWQSIEAGTFDWTCTQLGDLPAGVYYLRWSDDQHHFQYKIVK